MILIFRFAMIIDKHNLVNNTCFECMHGFVIVHFIYRIRILINDQFENPLGGIVLMYATLVIKLLAVLGMVIRLWILTTAS